MALGIRVVSFAEDDFSAAFDNVVGLYNLTLVECEVLLLHLHSVLGPIWYSQLFFA
jgi:hypothetical protein